MDQLFSTLVHLIDSILCVGAESNVSKMQLSRILSARNILSWVKVEHTVQFAKEVAIKSCSDVLEANVSANVISMSSQKHVNHIPWFEDVYKFVMNSEI